MTPRQRVLAALSHHEADRVPIDLGGRHTMMHVLAHRRLKEFLGLHSGSEEWGQFWLQVVRIDPRLVARFGGDVVCFLCGQPDAYPAQPPKGGMFTDEWGTIYRMPPDGYYYDVYREPLKEGADEAALARYPWPDPHDPGRTRGLLEAVTAAHSEGERAIMLAGVPSLWEHSWFVRGMAESLSDLALNPTSYGKLLDRLVLWQADLWSDMLGLVGSMVDVVVLSGDLGTQKGPMVSPRSFREVLKPRLAELVAHIKRMTNARVYLHSCGSVYAFIRDLIEVGVDILNPVQVNARDMEPERLKREFGQDIVFWGGGCSPVVLEYGTPEDVRQEVGRNIRALAPGGGYVFGSIHHIQARVPPENIVAFFDAAHEFGTYPFGG